MTPRDLILVVIERCSRKGEFGRTSLQKVTYFLAVILGVDLGHHAYFFGPYSSAVESDTEALGISGLILESVEILGTNSKGWPVRRYIYTLTEDGKKAVEELQSESPREVARVVEAVDNIELVVGSLDQKVLSAAAKVLYIAREEMRAVQLDEIGLLALEHQWTLSTQQIEGVASMLRNLGLAKVE